MLRLSLLWGFALMLMPALLIQGWWVKKRAIRMGPADGPSRGFAAEEKNQSRKERWCDRIERDDQSAAQVLGLGDSVIAGVGLASTN